VAKQRAKAGRPYVILECGRGGCPGGPSGCSLSGT
jgi:hypothetical protein